MKKLVLSLICIAALVACKKEKVTGPEGPQGPAGSSTTPSGTISGHIDQYDQYYGTYTTNLNTTTVSIDGTSNTTVTDIAGNYTLTNIPPGVYDISLIKNGCGLTKRPQVVFPGNGTLYVNSSISDKASFLFTGGYVKDTLSQIKVKITFAPVASQRYAIIIYGKTSNVDIASPLSYDQHAIVTLNQNSTSYTNMGPYSGLDSNKFPSGTTVYVKVYPNNSANTSYMDYSINKFVYTGCGTPLPTTFTLTMP